MFRPPFFLVARRSRDTRIAVNSTDFRHSTGYRHVVSWHPLPELAVRLPVVRHGRCAQCRTRDLAARGTFAVARGPALRQNHRVRLALCSAFAVVLLGVAARAVAQERACVCSCPGTDAPPFLDAFAPTRVGIEPRILTRMEHYDPSSLDFGSVPFSVESTGDTDGRAFWVVPSEALRPGQTYVLSVHHRTTTHVYSARMIVDETLPPPSATALRVVSAVDERACFDLVGGTVEAESLGPGVQAVELELEREGVLISRVFPSAGLFGSGSTSDSSDCFGGSLVPGLVEGETLLARVRIWDTSGRASSAESFAFVVERARAAPLSSGCGSCALVVGRGQRQVEILLLFATAALFVRSRRCPRPLS